MGAWLREQDPQAAEATIRIGSTQLKAGERTLGYYTLFRELVLPCYPKSLIFTSAKRRNDPAYQAGGRLLAIFHVALL